MLSSQRLSLEVNTVTLVEGKPCKQTKLLTTRNNPQSPPKLFAPQNGDNEFLKAQQAKIMASSTNFGSFGVILALGEQWFDKHI